MPNSNTAANELVFTSDSKGLQSLIAFLKRRAFNDPTRSLALIEEGLKVANKFINPKYRLDLLSYKGALQLQKGLFPHALEVFEEAKRIAHDIKDEESISRIYNNIGLILKSQEKYTEALDSFHKSLKYSASKQNPYIYSNIGAILYLKNDHDKALQYYTNALYLAEKLEDQKIICVCCINIGQFYQEREEYTKAIEYLERGLKIARENDELLPQRGMFLQVIGSVHADMKSYPEALDYLVKANEIFRKHGLFVNLTNSLIDLAKTHKAKDDFSSALVALEEAIEICALHNYSQQKIECLKISISCYDALNDTVRANEYLRQLVTAQEEHYRKENASKVREVLQSKENELDVLLKKNQQIERQNTLLEESNIELKQYAHIIAHDLKEPLRNINSFTNLLARFNKDLFSEDSMEFMKIVESNATMMSKKLDDLLNYVAIKMDHSKLEVIDVENLIYKVLNVLQRELRDNKIMLQVQGLKRMFVIPGQLRLLFYHLIKNAIQNIDTDKDFHTIHISSEQNGDFMQFCIEDNGVGIDKAFHEKIFMIFKRLSRKDNGGTGIGLAICEKIVRLYDGKIWIESKEKEGTKIFFTLKILEN